MMSPYQTLLLLPLLFAAASVVAQEPAPVAQPLPAPQLYWSADHLGLDVLAITPELRAHYGAPATTGVLVGAVMADGPADTAGIRVGDVVIEINGQEVDSPTRFRAVVRQQPAASMQVTVVRYGELHIFSPVYQQSRSRGRIVIQLPANQNRPSRDIQIELPDLQQEMQVIRDQMQRMEDELDRLADTLNNAGGQRAVDKEELHAPPPAEDPAATADTESAGEVATETEAEPSSDTEDAVAP